MTPLKDEQNLAEVLQLFLQPDYNIVSTTYLDILLSHISDVQPKSSTADNTVNKLVFQKWVTKALKIWASGIKPCQAVVSFTLKLIGMIARDESIFLYWQREHMFANLCTILELRDANLTASVKMAYTAMLLDLITHTSGRQWVIESGVWKDVVRFCHLNHTMYVTRESQRFVSTLLLLESQNPRVCIDIILEAAGPLVNNSFSPQIHPSLEENYLDQNKLLFTTIDLLTNILESTLFVSMDNTIPTMLEALTNLEARSKGLFETCISTQFLLQLLKLLVLLLFLKLKQGLRGPEQLVDPEYWEKFRIGLYYINSLLVSKKHIVDVLKTGKIMLIYWRKVRSLCAFKLHNPHYKFDNQVLAVMIMPLYTCVRKFNTEEDIVEDFVNKLFHVTCMYTQRLCYGMREVVLKENLPMEYLAKTSIQLILDVLNYLERDVAVTTFQTMCHVLRNYMPPSFGGCGGREVSPEPVVICSNGCKIPTRVSKYKFILEGDPMIDCPGLLSALLNGLTIMTEKFKLKWQECVETICVLSLAQEILSNPNVIPKLCVQALTLCKVAIQNFMPPNLALLVDSASHMDAMGPVLFKRIHDPNWEVRDSVLEVINTMATISEDKYTAFQDFLLINGLPELVVDIVTTDGESYVRASALTCIATMVRINKIWEEKLCQLNLPAMAMKLMTNESEGIVRKEAVVLLKELYIYRKWSKTTINEMAQAMAAAAVLDLHWEVKVNALAFWKQFIKSHFMDQGMLDGSFPTVTFSKENRKIVLLNESEIKRRLSKALDELSKQSCLGVLLVTLEDDSDFQVCKASADIINKLKCFLLKYKMDEPSPVSPLPKDSAIIDEPYVKQDINDSHHNGIGMSNNQNTLPADVIDSIVNADDMNLLASVYKNSMTMDSENERSDNEKLKFVSDVSRNDFLRSILNADIDAYIQEKSRWLKTYTNSFNSVLEDILTAHQKKDINSMDCY